MSVHVNLWAVVVCGIASMLIGWVWYGPLFGKAWMQSAGIDMSMMNDPARRKEMQSKTGPGYAIMFVGALVMAYVMAKALGHFGITAVDINFLKVVGGLWLGFTAAGSMLGVKIFENKGWTYYAIVVGYQLINMLVYGLILVSWK